MVVADDPESLGQCLELRVPHPPVAEAAVDQDDRRALAQHLVIQAAAIDRDHSTRDIRGTAVRRAIRIAGAEEDEDEDGDGPSEPAGALHAGNANTEGAAGITLY